METIENEAFSNDPWIPKNTYIYFVVGDYPEKLQSNQLVHYTLLSDAIFVRNLAISILGIPSDNILIFIKGKYDISETIFNQTDNQSYNQSSISSIKVANITNLANVYYYVTSDDFFEKLEFLDWNSNKRLILFLDNHGTNGEFGNMTYLQLYSSLLKLGISHIRIIVEACKSGSFISSIKQYNKWFNRIFPFSNDSTGADIETYKQIISLIFDLKSVEDVRYLCNVIEGLVEKRMLGKIMKISTLDKIPDISDSDPIELHKRFIPFYKILESCSVKTIRDLRLIIKVAQIVLPGQYRAIPSLINKRLLDDIMKICDQDCVLQDISELFQLSEIGIMYPPPNDFKIITSSGVNSDSFSFLGFRINPFTKIIAGSPVMVSAIKEIFFNFGEGPIDFERAAQKAIGHFDEYRLCDDDLELRTQPTHWMQLYPQVWGSDSTSYDRIVRADWNSIILKAAAVRFISKGVTDAFGSMTKALSTKAIAMEQKIMESTYDQSFILNCLRMKVPSDVIEASLKEKEMSDLSAVGAAAALSFGLDFTRIRLNFKELSVPEYIQQIIIHSIKVTSCSDDASLLSSLALKRIHEKANRSMDLYQSDDPMNAISNQMSLRYLILEEMSEVDASVAVIEALLFSSLSATSEEHKTNIDLVLSSKDISQSVLDAVRAAQSTDEIRQNLDSLLYQSMANAIKHIVNLRNEQTRRLVFQSFDIYRNDVSKFVLTKELQQFVLENAKKIITLVIDYSIEDINRIIEIIKSQKELEPPTIQELVDVAIDILPYSTNVLVQNYFKEMDPMHKDSDDVSVLVKCVNESTYLLLKKNKVKTVKEAKDFTYSLIIEFMTKNIISFKPLLRSAMVGTRIQLKERQMNIRSINLMFDLINKSLLDTKIVEIIFMEISAANKIEDKDEMRTKVIRRCAIYGKRLWQESVKGNVTVKIPREPSIVEGLMPQSEADLLFRAGVALSLMKKEIDFTPPSDSLSKAFEDSGLIQDCDIKEIAIHLLLSHQLVNKATTEAIGRKALGIAAEKHSRIDGLIEACKASDIIPDENDVFLLLGEANFHPDWEYSTLPAFRRVDERREESSAYDENGKIISNKEKDEYYIEPEEDKEYGYTGSGMFHSLSEDYGFSEREEKEKPDYDQDPTDYELAEIATKYTTRGGWANDVYTIFTGQFEERVKELGLSFSPYKTNQIAHFNRQYQDAYQAALNMLPMHRLKAFHEVKNSYAIFFYENRNNAEELKKAFIRSFDEADRIATPRYYLEETYYTRYDKIY